MHVTAHIAPNYSPSLCRACRTLRLVHLLIYKLRFLPLRIDVKRILMCENSIRNSCQANMSESQRNGKRHLDLDCYIGDSYQLCHYCTIPWRGFAFADQWWCCCGDWCDVLCAILKRHNGVVIEERKSWMTMNKSYIAIYNRIESGLPRFYGYRISSIRIPLWFKRFPGMRSASVEL